MKRLLLGTALALFGLVPTIGSACEYQDASMASSAAYAQLGLKKLRRPARHPRLS